MVRKMSLTVKLRQNGRVVIPQATREMYDLREGDLIDIEILRVKHPDGSVIDFTAPLPAAGTVQEAKEVEA